MDESTPRKMSTSDHCTKSRRRLFYYLTSSFRNLAAALPGHGVLVLLPSERAAFSEASLASGRLAKHGRAAGAQHDGLRMREHGRDPVAAGTLDVHEERVGRLNESLQLASALLLNRTRVE